MLEIEIKVRVPDIATIRNHTIACGGKHSETLNESDT